MEELGQEADYLDTTIEWDDVIAEETDDKRKDTTEDIKKETLFNRDRAR